MEFALSWFVYTLVRFLSIFIFLQHHSFITLFQMSFWNSRSLSLADMYIDQGDPSEKQGELNFSLDYDYASQTLKLKIIQVSYEGMLRQKGVLLLKRLGLSTLCASGDRSIVGQ